MFNYSLTQILTQAIFSDESCGHVIASLHLIGKQGGLVTTDRCSIQVVAKVDWFLVTELQVQTQGLPLLYSPVSAR